MKLISFLPFILVLLVSIQEVVGYIRFDVQRGHRKPSKTIKWSVTQKRYNLLSRVSTILTNIDNIYYYGEISMGSPPRKFRLNFDTGSSDFWIISSNCTSASCKKHNRFDGKKSYSFKNHGLDFEILYGDGSYASGKTCFDSVTIGRTRIDQVGFAQIDFLYGMDDEQNDGILGLAYKSLATTGFDTLVDMAFKQKKIPSKIVGFWLTDDPKSTRDGSLSIGSVESAYFKGPITYVPVTQKKYWQFKMNKVWVSTVNSSMTVVVCKKGCEAILDTGTTLIWGPTDMTDKLNLNLGASYNVDTGLYIFDCAKINSLGRMNFGIGNRTFSLAARDYVFKYEGTCYSAINSGSERFWIMGDVFLRKFYSIYDSSNDLIGLADAR